MTEHIISLRVFLFTVAFLLGLMIYISLSLSNKIEQATHHMQAIEMQKDAAARQTLFEMVTESEDRLFKVIALRCSHRATHSPCEATSHNPQISGENECMTPDT